MLTTRSHAFFAAMVLGTVAAAAHLHTDSVEVRFRQAHWHVDTAFAGNGDSIDAIIGRLAAVDSDYVVSGIRVVGGASPEGSAAYNRGLSARRAHNIFDYLAGIGPFGGAATSFTAIGRDWWGLRAEVVADPAVPQRDDVIAALDDIIGSIEAGEPDSQANLLRIKAIGGGLPYAYMYRVIFPHLRESRVYVDYAVNHRIVALPRTPATIDVPALPVTAAITDVVFDTTSPRRPFYMAIKTNLLHDALALPSIGAEIYAGRNLSVAANWTYGWWDTDRRHRYWRAYGGDVTVRWWFGRAAHRKPLTGHHVGVYGGVFTYDFEWGGTGYMGGRPGHSLWDRCLVNAGIEYGYSLPVARRLNIDFTIGLGYVGGKYYKYEPRGDRYVYKSLHNVRWFGPAKAEIALVWLIGRGNTNATKGGGEL